MNTQKKSNQVNLQSRFPNMKFVEHPMFTNKKQSNENIMDEMTYDEYVRDQMEVKSIIREMCNNVGV